jgi:lipopolysaccharide transport system permease protein
MFAVRDTKAKYRSSFFGVMWALVPPIFAAVTLTAARNSGVLNFGETSIPYPAFVVLSVCLWQTFTAALTKPIVGLLAARSILTKVNFPREVIILSECAKLTISALIQALLAVAVFVYFKVPVAATAPLIVFSLLAMMLVGLTISILLAPVALLYGDVSNAMPLIIGALFVITPVVYVAPPPVGLFSWVVSINPLTPLMEVSRELVYAPVLNHLGGFLLVVISTIPLACLALVLFRLSMPIVVERWSS